MIFFYGVTKIFLVVCLIIGSSSFNITTVGKTRLVIGGALKSNSPILKDYESKKNVVLITAAGDNPSGDATSLVKFFKDRGIATTWIPVYGSNCKSRCSDDQYIQMVKKADAMYFSGGKSGNLQVCLFGGAQSGDTPLLKAIRELDLVGGSSAGAMVQPEKDILITGTSSASYQAVRDGSVYYRAHGNSFISDGLVDVHFSERGRQGRLLVLAVKTRTPWAFGIDENTAFKTVSDGGIEIIGGTGGVIVFQDATSMTNAKMHYLTNGDTISKDGVITFAAGKQACPSTTKPSTSNSIFNSVNFKKISIGAARYSQTIRVVNHHGSSPAVEVIFDNSKVNTVCSGNLVSFTGLIVSMSKSLDYVNPEVYPVDNQTWMLDI